MRKNLEKGCLILADIFIPLVPGFVISGLAAGIAGLIPAESSGALAFIADLLQLVNLSFSPFLVVWIGYLAVKRFGGTGVLGGMLGMMTLLDELGALGVSDPSGRVVAVFFAAFCLAMAERWISSWMPSSVSVIFTPLLALSVIIFPYLFLLLPLGGLISNLFCTFLYTLSSAAALPLKILSGFIAGALFLPLNLLGLQHGIIALYPVELEQMGYLTLYPVFSMAGAAQVGAALAVVLRAKRENPAFSRLALSAAFPGMLGVGAPLLYGVTIFLPGMLLSSSIASGIAGAAMLLLNIVTVGWGPSGLLALPLISSLRFSRPAAMVIYLAGLGCAALIAFVLTVFTLSAEKLKRVRIENDGGSGDKVSASKY